MPASSALRLLLLLAPILLLAPRASVSAAAGAGVGVGTSGGGQLWCVAKNNADDGALQSAIDWACSAGGGRADCAAIQQGGACYDPPDLQRHASYAFNDYFLRAGGAANPVACDFSGAAALTALNPSYGSCVLPSRLVHCVHIRYLGVPFKA
ncbi:plasmodesmata callose-binding protein 5 [Dichanthelium oligosanthes]|uniref:Plasmodesmata callose-binding protein 5 n=1 Tax=Dichanthelium oligosanthes TaxID=888268 RepID=A0A1E5UV32_9POAL|nr:plasmodesmata callose-binding protein 5 [Dichanthelium oligosanthes]